MLLLRTTLKLLLPIFRAIPIALFVCVLILYTHNLSRSVYGGDVGDLVTSAAIMGVPHPPGYPLFTVLGNLLVHLAPIFGSTPAFMVGLISAFSGAAAVLVYYFFARESTKSVLIALLSACVLATTFLFWFYAEIAEVFELNNFFAVSLLMLSYLYRKKKTIKYLYLLAFTAGLSLTNHHTIILIFPGVLLMVGNTLWHAFRERKRVFFMALLCALVGFSVYVYVIISSSKNPHIDWGNVKSVQSFFDLVLRKKYGTFQLALFHGVTVQARLVVLKTYFVTLLTQLTIPVILLSLLGAISLLRRDRIVAIALIVSYFIAGPFFVVYAGFFLDNSFYFGIYERFLSLSTVVFLFFFPFGVQAFSYGVSRFFTRKEYVYLFQLVFFLIPCMLLVYNFPKTNLSQLTAGDDLGKNYLSVLPRNSLLYLSGDTNLFNTWYMRYAMLYRKDIEVFNGLSPEKTTERYGARYGLSKRTDFIPLLDKLDREHPIFSDIRFNDKKLSGIWMPYGLAYEYRSKAEKKMSYEEYLQKTESIWSSLTLPTEEEKASFAYKNPTNSVIPEMYANALVVTGNYFLSEYKNVDTAMMFYEKALEIEPLYAKAYGTIGAVYLTNKENCSQAIPQLRKAIDLYQFEKKYYLLLYLAYSDCNVSSDAKDQLSQAFKKYFATDIQGSLKQYSKEELKAK